MEVRQREMGAFCETGKTKDSTLVRSVIMVGSFAEYVQDIPPKRRQLILLRVVIGTFFDVLTAEAGSRSLKVTKG